MLGLAMLWQPAPKAKLADGPIGIFSSIPLTFANPGDMTLNAETAWPREVIATFGEPRALDSLVGDKGADPLAGITRLVIAQPRALSPQENVALDAWVRGGGKLLLLIDPMYTGHSDFALGDPRRAQTLAMLGPVLAHWGLQLTFDEANAPERLLAKIMGLPVPMELPGSFVVMRGDSCRTWDNGLAVTCALGRGRVYALADASVIDPEADDPIHRDALKGLLEAAFAID